MVGERDGVDCTLSCRYRSISGPDPCDPVGIWSQSEGRLRSSGGDRRPVLFPGPSDIIYYTVDLYFSRRSCVHSHDNRRVASGRTQSRCGRESLSSSDNVYEDSGPRYWCDRRTGRQRPVRQNWTEEPKQRHEWPRSEFLKRCRKHARRGMRERNRDCSVNHASN